MKVERSTRKDKYPKNMNNVLKLSENLTNYTTYVIKLLHLFDFNSPLGYLTR